MVAKNPKRKILLSLLLGFLTLLLVSLGFLLFFFLGKTSENKGKPTFIQRIIKRGPPTYTCPIDGLKTTKESSTRRPLAIMIENAPASRPQSNLDKACLVMEALAEGGVTRFMAIYVHNEADNVGPVRSARTYYLQILQGFKALFAHVGGSVFAMKEVKEWKITDLDQFFNPQAYWRVNTRKSPHNMYTSTLKLREQARVRGYEEKVDYSGFKHKKDAPLKERPEGARVAIDFSYPQYKVEYQYEKASNSYLRFMGGSPHIDAASSQQLKVKNIVVVLAETTFREYKAGVLEINLIGSGQALIFRDGGVVKGSWQKPALEAQITFYDEEGKEVSLNAGQIFLEVVKPTTAVTY